MSSTTNAFFDAVKNRRTYYGLDKKAPIPDARVKEILETALLNVPSSFNVQSARIVALFGAEHEALWDIVLEVLQGVTPKEQFEGTKGKIASFRGSYGTVGFFNPI
jgi:predicted oxidoreductase (fatty acid repression mutant protein)